MGGNVGSNILEAVNPTKGSWNPGKRDKDLLSGTIKDDKRNLEKLGIKKEKRPAADPAAERAAAEAAATTQANARIAFQRRAMRENSLLTGGGQTAAVGTGRTTLGV